MSRGIALTAACMLLLAGCASSHSPGAPAGYAQPQQPASHARLPAGNGGSYKTGRPYRVAGKTYYPMQSVGHYDETGIASWYGRDFHGRKTANGERYDMHALSAAHKTLPMPTLVRVTNLENGRSVIVRVNDRGPFVKNRLIDLSYAAARRLGFQDKGTARVRVQTLDLPPPTQAARPARQTSADTAHLIPVAWADDHRDLPAGSIFVQLGAFTSRSNAESLRRRLDADFDDVLIQPRHLASQTFYRVRIGPLSDMRRIEETVRRLQQQGFDNATVIIE